MRPEHLAFCYLMPETGDVLNLTNKDLWLKINAVASLLQRISVPGDCILLFFPPGLDYIIGFYGCLLAGVIAVPLYPQRRSAKSNRITSVARNCKANIGLTIKSELANIKSLWDQENSSNLPMQFYSTDDVDNKETSKLPSVSADAPAFLQYTSGSTGDPKGVIITHGNIIANVSSLTEKVNGTSSDVFVNWLPLFHDFGLVTAVLWPSFLGATSFLMAPATFVRNPAVWLNSISHYRGTICGAPNFAYDLCIDKIPESCLQTLNLESWRIAYNAAEPISAKTLNNFSFRFSRCGFKESAIYPSYGMAEATVFIAGGNVGGIPKFLSVNRNSLVEQKIELVSEDHPCSVQIVSCGSCDAYHDLKIVDSNRCTLLGEGLIGEVWFAGPSVSAGYWNMDDLTISSFKQCIKGCDSLFSYLRTGDLGFIWGGELFITGRIKDLIILRGKNYYPQDIEIAVSAAHFAVRKGYCVAFSVDENESQKLIVVAEVEREYFRNIDTISVAREIRQRIAQECSLSVDQVVLLKPYRLPITSSGKVQRRKTKQLFIAGQLDVLAQESVCDVKNYVPPRSFIERTLCEIWCLVLKLDRVSVEDNFFDLGGSSLAGLEICYEIRNRLDFKDFDLEYLLEFPTIENLGNFIELTAAHKKSKKKLTGHQQNSVVRI